MTRSKFARRMARPVGDFLFGLGLFGAVVLPSLLEASRSGGGWLASSAHAHLFEIQMMDRMFEMAAIAPVSAGQPGVLAVICMAMAFASLFSLNLWFARHVRKAHASYRRAEQ